MNDHPILFNAEMVRAILARTKTQTRRPIKPQPTWFETTHYLDHIARKCARRFGAPGDRLWVQETWGITAAENRDPFELYDVLQGEWQLLRRDIKLAYHYRASENYPGMCWRPSIHMPRSASRTDLLVKRVWVERVQDISEEDAAAEGFWDMKSSDGMSGWGAGPPAPSEYTYRNTFRHFWDSICAAKGFGWDENPWVDATEFELIEKARKS